MQIGGGESGDEAKNSDEGEPKPDLAERSERRGRSDVAATKVAKVEERRECGRGREEQRFEKREETSSTIRGAAVREDKVSILGGSKQI